MSTLKTFTKQPADMQDYDIDFATEYLADLTDTASSFTVDVPTGITLEGSAMTAGVVKVWLSGGTHAADYKITVTVTTAGGRVHQAEITIKVRET